MMRKRRLLLWVMVVATLFAFTPTALAVERHEVLMLGDRDEYVLAIQQRLIALGFMEGKATGYFGTATQQAVIDYQTRYGLAADGKAGPVTLASLMGEGFTLPRGRAAGNGRDASAYYPGDKGEAVAALQKNLQALEYYDYASITGYYGPVTQRAVERFQRTNGLSADGVAGPETLELLASGGAKYYCIYPGDSGADVEQLQARLQELGYYQYGGITGYFGTATERALMEFQAQCGLAVDAKAGKNTRALLYSAKAPLWDGTARAAGKQNAAAKASPVDRMLGFAMNQIDKKYVYSTEGPSTFDCSGFIYYVLKYSGVSTARCSANGFSSMESWVKISSQRSLKPGDLLFFKSDASSRISHMGIYLGSGQFLHASASGGCVRVNALSDYYSRNFVLARRVF